MRNVDINSLALQEPGQGFGEKKVGELGPPVSLTRAHDGLVVDGLEIYSALGMDFVEQGAVAFGAREFETWTVLVTGTRMYVCYTSVSWKLRRRGGNTPDDYDSRRLRFFDSLQQTHGEHKVSVDERKGRGEW